MEMQRFRTSSNFFFINTKSATSLDLELLGEDIRMKVWQKYKIKLQWEIIRIGEFKEI